MVFAVTLKSILDGSATSINEFSKLSKDQSKQICLALKANSKLKNLELKNADLSNGGAEHLADALKENQSLTKLRLISTRIGDTGAETLGEALANNNTLSHLLLLVGNRIGDRGTEFLAKGLHANTSLVTFALSHTRTGDEGAMHISNMLRRNKTLEKLGLSHTKVGDKGAMFLAKGLKSNTSLESLYLRFTRIGDEGASYIGEALKVNRCLVKLYLSYTNIGDSGARHLAEGIKDNNRLEMLFLNNTMVADEGAANLSEALKVNESLVILNLGNTLIGDKGAAFLADALKMNHSLVKLSLIDTPISQVGAALLVQGLKINKSLTKLIMDIKQIGEAELEECQKTLKRNRNEKQRLFLDTLNSELKAPWNRSRLMFVGQGRSGKTSTVRSLLGQPFIEAWDSTIGAAISESKRAATESQNWLKLKKPKSKQQLLYSARHAAIIMVKANKKKETFFSRIFRHKNYKKKEGGTDAISRKESDMDCIENADSELGQDVEEEEEDNFQSENIAAKSNTSESLLESKTDVQPCENSEEYGEEYTCEKQDSLLKDENSECDDTCCRPHDIVHKFYERLLVDARHDAETLHLSLWDFAGQEVFYSMHHIFLTKTGLYVLVFDAREVLNEDTRQSSLLYLSFWLNSIKLHSPTSPLLIVGTCFGQVQDTMAVRTINKLILRMVDRKHFPYVVKNSLDRLSFFPVDNQTSQGIDRLRTVLGEEARKESALRHVPVRWLGLLDEIIFNHGRSPYMRISDVRKLGNQVGIKQIAEQEEALSLFHEYGMIFRLTSTEVLKDLVVIEPQWLLDSLSKVIRDRVLHPFEVEEIQRFGLTEDVDIAFDQALASRDFLEYVWDKTQVKFLLDVMKHTMLLSAWNFLEGEYYLIPSLLRHDSINDEESDGFLVIYDFAKSFLPNGVFQRLICLCVEYISSGNIPRPVLSKYSATLQFREDVKVDLRCIPSEACILLYVECESYAAEVLSFVNSMMLKINSEAMGGRLSWNTSVEDAETGNMVDYAQARMERLDPWFMDTEESRLTASSINVESFFE